MRQVGQLHDLIRRLQFAPLAHLAQRGLIHYQLCAGPVRVVLFLVLIPVALRTQACAGHRLRRFYVGWAAVGGAWALSLPLVTFVAASLPPYTRHRTVQWVCSLVQTAALVLYALLFAGRANRAFREASTVGDGGANLDFGSSLPRRSRLEKIALFKGPEGIF